MLLYDEGKPYNVFLVNDGTLDTVFQIEGRQLRFNEVERDKEGFPVYEFSGNLNYPLSKTRVSIYQHSKGNGIVLL